MSIRGAAVFAIEKQKFKLMRKLSEEMMKMLLSTFRLCSVPTEAVGWIPLTA